MNEHVEKTTSKLNSNDRAIVERVFNEACKLLDHSSRFRFFTLHGKEHLENLFRILGIFLDNGIELTQRELYLTSLAICTHDLGMVVGMNEKTFLEVSEGRKGFSDPSLFENIVRDIHHEIISQYFSSNFNFMTGLGVSPADLGLISEIGKCHRKENLMDKEGHVKRLGALLRLIDELDVGPNRAPTAVFLNLQHEMDPISCWHWFKHNITEDWHPVHNVNSTVANGKKKIEFSFLVHPTRADSVKYWLTQAARPLIKALDDEHVAKIMLEEFGVHVTVQRSANNSTVNSLGEAWADLENRALTHGRATILAIDDEIKKIDDLFFALMEDYHIQTAPNLVAGFQYLSAAPVALVIMDLQISGSGKWTANETEDFKKTGFCAIKEIREKWPHVKVGVLTGTKHDITTEEAESVDFFFRKPIDPLDLRDRIAAILNE